MIIEILPTDSTDTTADDRDIVQTLPMIIEILPLIVEISAADVERYYR